MIEKIANFIIKNRWYVVGVWVIAAIAIATLSPNISTIQSNDQSSFLPSSYESVKAANIAKLASKNSAAPTDIIVFKNQAGGPLSASQQDQIHSIVSNVNNQHIPHVSTIVTSPQELSKNHTVQLATIVYSGSQQDSAVINTVPLVRSALTRLTNGTGISASVTGGESIAYDTQGAANNALKIVGIGTILLVLILPALIFRSPLAGLLPVFSVGVVYSLATALISDAGHVFHFHLSQQLSVLFTVVLFGIGTDYILFLLFRYRERLRTGDHTRQAVVFALSRAGEAILSAALVVLSSFAALFFAKFGIFSSLAPGLVICVIVMMLAALTFVPALVAIIGEKIFWPSKAWMIAAEKPTISKRIGGLVAKRPGSVSMIVIMVLVVAGLFATQFNADFSSFSEPPKNTQSATAYTTLTHAFPAGQSNPTIVYIQGQKKLTTAALQPLSEQLARTQGVAKVLPIVLAKNRNVASISIILKNDPYSSAAISDVSGPVRQSAHEFDTTSTKVYVGGATSAIADVKAVTNRDLAVIFPIAAAFIFVILAILLRSLVAPIVLLFCVSLGYVATLGVTTIIFQDIGKNTGLISFIPLFMYIFVVAIGTDYNILTVTRLREEIKEGNKPRRAADLTIEHSSATVVSAGIILAGTFGSLLLAGISFLSQMGSSIAIGVALAAFVIAPFLIPSFSAVIGYTLWWPSHRKRRPAAQ